MYGPPLRYTSASRTPEIEMAALRSVLPHMESLPAKLCCACYPRPNSICNSRFLQSFTAILISIRWKHTRTVVPCHNQSWIRGPERPAFFKTYSSYGVIASSQCNRICRRKHGDSKNGIEGFPSSAATRRVVARRPFRGRPDTAGMVVSDSG